MPMTDPSDSSRDGSRRENTEGGTTHSKKTANGEGTRDLGENNADARPAVTPSICPAWTKQTDRFIHRDIPRVVIAISLVAVRRPRIYIAFITALALTLILVGASTNFYYAVDELEQFGPYGVRPVRHKEWLDKEAGFPDTPRTFVLMIHRDGKNILGFEEPNEYVETGLGREGIRRAFEALDTVRNLPGYSEVCAQSTYVDQTTNQTTCLISSATRFWSHNITYYEETASSDQRVRETLSAEQYHDAVPVDTHAIMGHPRRDENDLITHALSYSIFILLPETIKAKEFEEIGLDHILRVRDKWKEEEGNTWRLETFAVRSYADEFARAVEKDLVLIPLVLIIMSCFTCLVFYRRHRVESRVLLGIGSVVTITMSIMSGYGLMFCIGVPFTNLAQLVPFVVFGVGLDDTFIIAGAFLRTDRRKDIEERVVDALQEIGLSITVTTVTTAFAFGLGTISIIPSVRWLCFYSMSTIVIDFFYQITYFIALLVLDEQRIQANRDAVIVCRKVAENDYETGEFEQEAREERSANFIDHFMAWFSRQIIRPAVRFCSIIAFLLFLAFCAYSTSNLTQAFKIEELVPDGSYVTFFFDAFQDYSARSLPIFAYFRDVDQSDSGIQEQMENFMNELTALEVFGDEAPYCWVTDFKEFLKDEDNAAAFQDMEFYDQVDALLQLPQVEEVYGDNIVFDDDGRIVASRCVVYAEAIDINDVDEQVNVLHSQRNVSASQPINENRSDWAFFAFDRIFITWEFYDTIVGEWIFTTITGVIAVNVIGFICMPHWTAILFIFPLIAMLYIDLIGTIQFAGLHINVVTHVSLAMSIGLLVDYIMHVLLGYYEAPGNSRQEKVQHTLSTVGSPVLIGGLSTFLGVLPLAFSSSAVMRTVFVCFVSMVALGCGHGIIFLPVVLSMFGPTGSRRTQIEENSLVVANSPSEKEKKIASTGEVFSYVWGCGTRTQVLLVVGCAAAALSGLVFPAAAFLFASALSSLSAAVTDFDQIREVSLSFLLLGLYGLVLTSIQIACLEIVATDASKKLRLQLFEALLRQDTAFFDVYGVASITSTVESSTSAFHLGIGGKLGQGIKFGSAAAGGLAFAFYSSWRLALVIVGIVPLSGIAAYAVVNITQNKKSHAQSAYANAGSVAYSTVSAIRTVLSLDSVEALTQLYSGATREAFQRCISGLWKEGLATGCMVGAFMLIHFTLTLYGGYLIYSDVKDNGCDPSGGVEGNETCDDSGPNVVGATLGVIFASLGIPVISTFVETFTASRVALRRALKIIDRRIGIPREEIYEDGTSEQPIISDDASGYIGPVVKAVLPPYLIDSSCQEGLKPRNVNGTITFEDVEFCYPSRPTSPVLSGVNFRIKAGTTVALVGCSGSGKSTLVALIERFYDPTRGRVRLDGIDLKELNVNFLRSVVAYVGQEPVVFAATISENIRNGMPSATQQEIEEAAKMANAHNFIMSFPNGYDTFCGENGAQLSGGQRQRLAIARALVGRRKILLLEEAKSDVNPESEIAVQTALENISSKSSMTTVIVANHGLSTTRIADNIAVIGSGGILEQGRHGVLMRTMAGYYRSLVEKQEGGAIGFDSSPGRPGPIDAPSSLDHGPETSESVSKYRRTGPMDPPTAWESSLEVQHGDYVNDSVVLKKTPTHTVSRPELTFGGAATAPNGELLTPEGGVPGVAISSQEPKLLSLSIAESPCFLRMGSVSNGEGTIDPIFAFKDVEFSYPTRPGKRVLDKLSLEVQQGETVALVGPSGGGKNTILSLLERFYDPDYGSVQFLGRDIKELNVSRYRNQIGYVEREPTLFNVTISANIALGAPNATQEDIENSAREVNAHEFIVSELPDGYDTVVGGRGSQLNRAQRQRIALARAWIRKPRVLLMDVRDSKSERAIQEALETLMEQQDLTVIVVSHRLSSVQKADRFIHIENGKALQVSESRELQEHYTRLLEDKSGSRRFDVGLDLTRSESCAEQEESRGRGEDDDSMLSIEMGESDNLSIAKRLFRMTEPDRLYIIVGIIGSLMVGILFPFWGFILAQAVDLLFRQVEDCTGASCQDQWNQVADEMRHRSFELGTYWSMLVVTAVAGFMLMFIGFGVATERLTKRIRDSAFSALTRQEVGFFDKWSVGYLSSQLEEDASRIYAFTGEPLRSFLIVVSSVLIGIAISFVYMWPLALMAILTTLVIGFAVSQVKQVVWGRDDDAVGIGTLGGSHNAIVADTVLNIRTVAALTLERQRYEDYQKALSSAVSSNVFNGLKTGAIGGITELLLHCVSSIQTVWAGWVIFNYPDTFQYEDFLVSLMTFLFSLFGLGVAFQGLADRTALKKSAQKIFYLLDRESRYTTNGSSLSQAVA